MHDAEMALQLPQLAASFARSGMSRKFSSFHERAPAPTPALDIHFWKLLGGGENPLSVHSEAKVGSKEF